MPAARERLRRPCVCGHRNCWLRPVSSPTRPPDYPARLAPPRPGDRGHGPLLAEAASFLRALDISLVYVGAGEFTMGSQEEPVQPSRLVTWAPPGHLQLLAEREVPAHRVQLGAFCIAREAVTVDQFRACLAATGRPNPIIGPAPGGQRRAGMPVCFVPWHEAVAFCAWLTARTGLPFRLPTEAEWERAARGTDGRPFPWGWELPSPWRANYGGMMNGPQPVSGCPAGASPAGCLNMSGNVWEWCADWFDPDYYAQSPAQNPTGPPAGRNRVIRGGAWDSTEGYLRCSARLYDRPYGQPFYPCGFRIATTGQFGPITD